MQNLKGESNLCIGNYLQTKGKILDTSYFNVWDSEEAEEYKIMKNCKHSKLCYGILNYISSTPQKDKLKDLFAKENYLTVLNTRKMQLILETIYNFLDITIRYFERRKAEKYDGFYCVYDNFINKSESSTVLEIVKSIDNGVNTFYLFTKDFPSQIFPLRDKFLKKVCISEDELIKEICFDNNKKTLNGLYFYSNLKQTHFDESIVYNCNLFFCMGNGFDTQQMVLEKKKSNNIDFKTKCFNTQFDRAKKQFIFHQNYDIKSLNRLTVLKTFPTELEAMQLEKFEEGRCEGVMGKNEFQDDCICPGLLFPLAKSSRSRPIQFRNIRSYLEKLGLCDEPVLQHLYNVSDLSIFFYDIETLLKQNTSKAEIKEPKLLDNSEMIENKFMSFFYGVQEPVCIASLSKVIEMEQCSKIWNKLRLNFEFEFSFEDIAFEKNILQILKKIPFEFKKEYTHKINFYIKEKFSTSENILEGCNVFHLSKNKCYNRSESAPASFTEPNIINMQDMVFRWLDKSFSQASAAKVLKALMLEPLFDQFDIILKSANCGTNKGMLTYLQRSLNQIILDNFMFG